MRILRKNGHVSVFVPKRINKNLKLKSRCRVNGNKPYTCVKEDHVQTLMENSFCHQALAYYCTDLDIAIFYKEFMLLSR